MTNEKYCGDALLQKKYTPDYLTKKQVVNHGEIPQYYVEDIHEAIIDNTEFDSSLWGTVVDHITVYKQG